MKRTTKKTVAKRGQIQDPHSNLMFADVILRSITGKSAMAVDSTITPQNVAEYLPSKDTLDEARRLLTALGFQINMKARTHITIAGTKDLFENTFRVRLTQKFAPYLKPPKRGRTASAAQSYFVPDVPAKISDDLSRVVEALEFPGPITYLASATPPPLKYGYMKVPGDVARYMAAPAAHLLGYTGSGIKLAMVDSGFMTPLHPYYAGKGYNIQLVPDGLDPTPDADDVGHGTAISACALAIAPGVTYAVYKIYSPALGSPKIADAFSHAVEDGANIITCSWGTLYSTALAIAINDAVAAGIVVCFACGNGGSVDWPGSEPCVISVGGAFIDDRSLQASDFASSGTNTMNPGRQVPDLCGITGMAPEGVLIAMPTQPGSYLDNYFAGSDGTTPIDAWIVASGTSSATPMVAATAALMMEVDRSLVGDPDNIKKALIKSCTDVSTGISANGEHARPGIDLATGAGLVQAYPGVNNLVMSLKEKGTNDVDQIAAEARQPA